jgi:hypothetical protein
MWAGITFPTYLTYLTYLSYLTYLTYLPKFFKTLDTELYDRDEIPLLLEAEK